MIKCTEVLRFESASIAKSLTCSSMRCRMHELEGEAKHLQKEHVLGYLLTPKLPGATGERNRLCTLLNKENLGLLLPSGKSLSAQHAVVSGQVPVPTCALQHRPQHARQGEMRHLC